MIQTKIDFTPSRKENNSFSQMFLDANLFRIKGNNKKVWELLNNGHRLTVNGAVIDYGISSLPRRIKDIEEILEIKIGREVIGETRFVEYYLEK